MAALLAGGGAYALASWDWCGPWPSTSPMLTGVAQSVEPLWAGAARVEVPLRYPVGLAGYGPLRADVGKPRRPMAARALVLQAGRARVGLVTLELLTLPASLAQQVQAAAQEQGLGTLWVGATHAHTSAGGYDARLLSELAGTGPYREEVRRALVDAAVRALVEARAALAAVTLANARVPMPGLVFPRSGQTADSMLDLVRLSAADGRPVASLWLLSAHPTLVARHAEALDTDWPGALAAMDEERGGVSLVLLGAVGNATAGEEVRDPEAFARAVHVVASAAAQLAEAAAPLAWSRVQVSLPRPDASRLVASPFRAVGDNFLCQSAEREAEVGALQLGSLKLLSVPGEPTDAAARSLLARSHADRVVSLVNGYVGYVEPEGVVAARQGEARRQYYQASLLDRLSQGAALAGDALRWK